MWHMGRTLSLIHIYLNNSFIVAVLNARQITGVFSYLVGKGALMTRSILHHIGRKLNLAKVERYRIAIL